MRPWIRWSLAASMALSIFVLLRPEGSALVTSGSSTNIDPTSSLKAQASVTEPVEGLHSTHVAGPLPVQLQAGEWTAATFDPFVGVAPPPPPVPKVVAPPVVVNAPVILPQPPAMNYRYLGQLVDPDGKQTYYVVRGDNVVPIAVGTKLDDGYMVEAIKADGIRLLYPPLGSRTVIYIPPPPDPVVP